METNILILTVVMLGLGVVLLLPICLIQEAISVCLKYKLQLKDSGDVQRCECT